MKRWIAALLLLPLCASLLGAAPIFPTRDFYVNDAAGIVIPEHKEAMLDISRWLYLQSGTQLVLLCVESIEDMGYQNLDVFADDVFTSWAVGGLEEENGLLIVAVGGTPDCTVRVGRRFAEDITPSQTREAMESVRSAMRKGNSTKALMDLYKALTLRVCEITGVEPPVAEEGQAAGSNSRTIYVMLMLSLLVVGRSIRVSGRYRRRYGAGRIRKRKTFSRPQYDDEMRDIKEMPERFNRVGREPTSGDD